MTTARDIQQEQITGSTSAELADRLAALIARYGKHGYLMAQLSEYHHIRDEQARREHTQENVWVG